MTDRYLEKLERPHQSSTAILNQQYGSYKNPESLESKLLYIF